MYLHASGTLLAGSTSSDAPLSGNARISVVCTLNPDPGTLAESLSTLGFARRVGGVKVRPVFLFFI